MQRANDRGDGGVEHFDRATGYDTWTQTKV